MSTTFQSTKKKLGVAPSKPSPRQRILAVARDFFYRQGIRPVSLDAIAAAAGTNKMTLYYHFASKDALVTECLRAAAQDFDETWDAIANAHQGDPRERLIAWLSYLCDFLTEGNDRGCALANAAIELPDKDHPARRLIDEMKTAQRRKLGSLCREGGYIDPECLADELIMVFEGARVSIQSVGVKGPAVHLRKLVQEILASHAHGGDLRQAEPAIGDPMRPAEDDVFWAWTGLLPNTLHIPH